MRPFLYATANPVSWLLLPYVMGIITICDGYYKEVCERAYENESVGEKVIRKLMKGITGIYVYDNEMTI